jgi:hypothetical protein
MARPTASAATQDAGPKSLAASRPTTVEIRSPPMSGRGCAGSAWGDRHQWIGGADGEEFHRADRQCPASGASEHGEKLVALDHTVQHDRA